jgi:hypothetical protein
MSDQFNVDFSDVFALALSFPPYMDNVQLIRYGIIYL